MPSASVLVIRALAKRYRAGVAGCWADARALVDVSLEIQCDEVVAVVGAAGAGKTTLFRCAARLLAPDEGLVEHIRRADGEASVVRYFADCLQADRATARGETWDLALVDDVDSVHSDAAFAFGLVRVLGRAKRDRASVMLAARDTCIVGELADRTLHLKHGRLGDLSSVVRSPVARVAEQGVTPSCRGVGPSVGLACPTGFSPLPDVAGSATQHPGSFPAIHGPFSG